MIVVEFGTARVRLDPSLTTRGDNGVAQEQYAFTDLAAAVRGVVRAAGGDPGTFAMMMRSMTP